MRLTNFRMPFSYKVRCKLSRLLTLGKVKASYRYYQDNVLIRIEFDGAYLVTVLQRLSQLLKAWGRQNGIHM